METFMVAGCGTTECPGRTMESKARLAYNDKIAQLRAYEYPMLEGATYLDHAGTTMHSRSLIEAFSADMMSTLVGNPHSSASSSQNSGHRIDDTRLRVLKLFNASPEAFEVVFVANATSGIKLVADAFRDHPKSFWYGYHKDAHTSLVGPRELAQGGNRCFTSDQEVEDWLASRDDVTRPGLFAYPAQSNFNGRRLPLAWPSELRRSGHCETYSLLDAAAYVTTTPLDLSDAKIAPDFTVLSFYKIFGFPDLGALIVRKASGHVFQNRKYFGGGTVEMVTCLGEQWHAKKEGPLHVRLEDGSLPVRNIMALDCAMTIHEKLFGGLSQISLHTAFLSKVLYEGLKGLRHGNSFPVSEIYGGYDSQYGDPITQGATVAFNLLSSQGQWLSNHEVKKLAVVKNFHIRTGTLCNPGGAASALGLTPTHMKALFASGFRCGDEKDVIEGKPASMIRVSLGAMSTLEDVEKFLAFIQDFFVDSSSNGGSLNMGKSAITRPNGEEFYIKSLTIYPIKSCGGWSVPHDLNWSIRPEGLAWDREWCLVHQGTRATLSQKRCPRMALLKPSLDLASNTLIISYAGVLNYKSPSTIAIPLIPEESILVPLAFDPACTTNVCGDRVLPRFYKSQAITDFFSNHLSIPCYLAWLTSTIPSAPHRVVRANNQPRKPLDQRLNQDPIPPLIPGAFPTPPPSPPPRPLLLANESPVLAISVASLDRLNSFIAAKENQSSVQIGPEVFRANILLAPFDSIRSNVAFIEDKWKAIRISRSQTAPDFAPQVGVKEISHRQTELQVLGPCRRCQMVCVNQDTGTRGQEPFVTLAQIRSWGGGVWFGVHCGLALGENSGNMKVGDVVKGCIESG